MSERRSVETQSCAAVTRALADIRRGAMVVLTDDEDRENEGDLVMAAEHCTAEAVNFMAREGRGLICLSLTEERVRRLALPLMVSENSSPFQTAFTVSIEAARGVTTGISAADRAHTIRTAIDPKARPSDLVRPGHVFPLRARDGGVLVRPGQTEGSVDLARLAGLTPAGVICEIMNDDGTMARRPELLRFARRHRMTLLSVADLITYRLAHESLVRRVGELVVDRSPFEGFRAYAYATALDAATHLALVTGDVATDEPVLARVHRAAPLRDLLDAASDGGALRQALDAIRAEGRGVLILLNPLLTAPEALALDGWATEPRRSAGAGPARLREIGLGAQILRELGVHRLRLLTHAPKRIVGLERFGLEVIDQRLLPPERPRRASGRRANPRRRAVAAAAVPL